MTFSRRALVFAVVTIVACEDPFTNEQPAASPGLIIPGLDSVGGFCSFVSACTAWSADSKTLYVIARLGTGVASLMAVDPTTLTARVVGPIDADAMEFHPTADGTALYFAGPDRGPMGGFFIERMSLTDGSTTPIAKLNDLDFVVAPSGTSLAYRAPSSPSSGESSVPPPDTIVVLALPSGARLRTMIGNFTNAWAFSSDGALLSVVAAAPALYILRLATSGCDTISTLRAKSALFNVAWSGGAFRMLYYTRGAPNTFTDTSLAGGSAVTYLLTPDVNRVLWVPDRSATWMLPDRQICGPQDCSTHYDFVFADATEVLTVGSVNSGSLQIVDASPDGQWVAHSEDPDALYLLHRITP